MKFCTSTRTVPKGVVSLGVFSLFFGVFFYWLWTVYDDSRADLAKYILRFKKIILLQ